MYLNDMNNEMNNMSGGETWFPYVNSRQYIQESSIERATSQGMRLPEMIESPQCSSSKSVSDLSAAIAYALQVFDAHHSIDASTVASTTESLLPGLQVKPRKGDAVLFFNHLPENLYFEKEGNIKVSKDGVLDVSAIHAGLPITVNDADELNAESIRKGKWVANYWF